MPEASTGTPQTMDDGAYAHLRVGMTVPEVRLPSTTGETVDVVSSADFTVLFLYPMTGTPGVALPRRWLQEPGAFGCTAESCSYRDHAAEIEAAGAAVHGVSTQTTAEQREFAERERIPYPLLSDADHDLVDALRLPLFAADGHPPRIKRATLVIDRERTLRQLMYPIPDPVANAAHALTAVRRLAADRAATRLRTPRRRESGR